ncbi:MAG: hypothetical protein K0R57_6420 [Paenibacillaceae bacterium]|jgi:hypothetical protein|nr:hypothetical protein [Paenibacillaceae bacterium]
MEKSILAYFTSPEAAGEAKAKLQALRVADARIDRVVRYPEEEREIQLNPSTGNVSGLGSLTQDAGGSTGDAAILMAADPAASGLSNRSGGMGTVTGRDILLTAVMDDSVHSKAVRLVEEAGGLL